MRQIPKRRHDLPCDAHQLILYRTGVPTMGLMEFPRAHSFDAVSTVAGRIEAWASDIDPTLRRY